ncbi:MAG: hypothetical protein NZ518_10900 [Dehalococcoidia bacterium]|nr:hypothetical protein [Dehalococcoidia bacterium]
MLERLFAAFGKSAPDPDDVAVSYTQAMLTGNADAVARMSAGPAVEQSRALAQKFAEADLARWFGRLRSLDAPPSALPTPPVPPVRRYVVGRVNLPDNATQDFPILTVGMARMHNRWMVVAARANSMLFEGSSVELPDLGELGAPIELADSLLRDQPPSTAESATTPPDRDAAR